MPELAHGRRTVISQRVKVMKINFLLLRGAVLAIASLLPQLHAEPRPPLPALPSTAMGLYHNRFDEAYWLGDQRGETVLAETETLVES